MQVAIRGGRIIDPANKLDKITDLFIKDGKVLSVGESPRGFKAEQVISAAGKIVIPGIVDLSAHLREPGHEHKATIASETRAAAHSGITTLCCPPDTIPIVDTPAVARLIRQRAEQEGYARVVVLGAMTAGLAGGQLSEMAALKDAGCVGVSNHLSPCKDNLVLRRALEYAATFDLPVFLYPDEPALRNNGCVHEGAVSTRLGLPGVPEAAETLAVARDLALIAQTGVRAHFCRLTSARAVRMVARAQHDGISVTADVAAHYLHLTEMDVLDFNSQCHVLPPLRSQEDREGLRQGLARSTVAAICSDHQPHEPDAKLNPFPLTEPGISGLDSLLPLSLRLVADGYLTLPELIAKLTIEPARILSLDVGTLSAGAPADVCIYDPEELWTLTPQTMASRGRNSPFMGWELKGRVSCTLLGGRVVFRK